MTQIPPSRDRTPGLVSKVIAIFQQREKRIRKALAHVLMFVAVAIPTLAAYSNWRADQKHIAELQRQSEVDAAEAAVRESLFIGQVIADVDGNILDFNPAMEKFTGRKKSDLIGKSLSVIIPEGMQDKHTQAFNAAMVEASKEKFKPKAQVIYCDITNAETGKTYSYRIGVITVKPKSNGSKPYVVAKVMREKDIEVMDSAAAEARPALHGVD